MPSRRRSCCSSEPRTRRPSCSSKPDAAVAAAEQLRDDVVDAVDTIVLALEDLIGAGQAQVETALSTPLQELRDLTTQMEQVAPQLPPLVRQQLLSIARRAAQRDRRRRSDPGSSCGS